MSSQSSEGRIADERLGDGQLGEGSIADGKSLRSSNLDSSSQSGLSESVEPDCLQDPNETQSLRSEWFLARWLYLFAGLLCLTLATAGAFLPVLPCTPFVLLAVYCFARSSKRLHGWLLRSKLFGGIIRDWQEHRAIRRRVRSSSVLLIVAVLAMSLWMLKPGLIGGLVIVGLVSIGLLVIFRLPVCD